jgi:outer membrane protein TolC
MKPYLLFLFIGLNCSLLIKGQQQLSLNDAIRIASDSSLAAFKAKNIYLADYWEYRTYLASLKPSLTLNSTLFDYNRSLTKRYNSLTNIDEYREQQSLYTDANASVSQNLPFSGGTLFLNSELSRIQGLGDNSYTQFNAVPLRIGLRQPIMAYNEFKWKRKIEPLKYEKAKKDYIKTTESISLQMVDYFFDLLVAKSKVAMAITNTANTDTLYNIGLKRFEIASLSQSEILTLKVDVLNARNKLAEANKLLKNAAYYFYSYSRLPENTEMELQVPEKLPVCNVQFEKVLSDALTNNPEVLGYQQQLLESESNLERARRESRLSASLNASYGLNQQNSRLVDAYHNPMDQQQASVGISIPIIDWGQRKGKYNMAQKNHEVTQLTVEQAKVDFRQQVMMAVTNYSMQADVIKSALETRDVARQAYETTKYRFLIGKADVNSLSLALERQDNAKLNYLEALRAYWKYYYTIRWLTLVDYENDKSISKDLDEKLGVN